MKKILRYKNFLFTRNGKIPLRRDKNVKKTFFFGKFSKKELKKVSETRGIRKRPDFPFYAGIREKKN